MVGQAGSGMSGKRVAYVGPYSLAFSVTKQRHAAVEAPERDAQDESTLAAGLQTALALFVVRFGVL